MMRDKFSNILVLKWGALGDFIAGTIAIQALREYMPNARITLLSNRLGIDICPPGALVDDVIDRDELKRRYGHIGRIRALSDYRFDLAVNLKWGSEGAALLSWFSAPSTAGAGKRWWRKLYTFAPPVPQSLDDSHEYSVNLSVAQAIGAKTTIPRAYIHVASEDHVFAEKFFSEIKCSEANTMLMTPGASKPEKMWYTEGFIEIGRRFVAHTGGKIIVTWVPQDEERARAVVNGIGAGAYLSPRTSIQQVAALTARSNICLCNNSGIMHVAYAVGTPYICLNTARTWAAYGERSIGINSYAEPGVPEPYNLLDRVTVEEVWKVLAGAGLDMMQRYTDRYVGI